MRWPEISGGFKVYVSNEENQLLDKIKGRKRVFKEKLTQREQDLANKLVTRGVLDRIKKDDKIAFEYKCLN